MTRKRDWGQYGGDWRVKFVMTVKIETTPTEDELIKRFKMPAMIVAKREELDMLSDFGWNLTTTFQSVNLTTIRQLEGDIKKGCQELINRLEAMRRFGEGEDRQEVVTYALDGDFQSSIPQGG